MSGIGKTKRAGQRNLDRQQKKEKVILTNRAEELPPPVAVVVMVSFSFPKVCHPSLYYPILSLPDW